MRRDKLTYLLWVVAALASLPASGLAVIFAIGTKAVYCNEEPSACRSDLFTGQLFPAIASVVFACVLAYAVFVSLERWLAIWSLVLLLVALLGVGLLNDAALHGWDNMKVF